MKTPILVIAAIVTAAFASDALASSEFSAKKKRRAKAYPPAYYYPTPVYVPAPYRHSADPSFGNRAGIEWRRAIGDCVIDLGYGRWESCHHGGGR